MKLFVLSFFLLLAVFACHSNAKLSSGIALPNWAMSLPSIQGTACDCRAGSVDGLYSSATQLTAGCCPIDDSLPALEPDPEYRCGCGTFANNLTCWQAGSSVSATLANVDTTACDTINVTATSVSDSLTVAPPCLDVNGNACGGNPGVMTYTTRRYSRNLVSLSCSVTVLRIQCTTPSCASSSPVNCLLGSFTDWTPCQLLSIGQPHKLRYKPIVHDGANGGTMCPPLAYRYEEQSCSETELLPLPCSYTNTTVSSVCSTRCGSGTRTVTTYNTSLVTKAACAIPSDQEIVLVETFPCSTNLPCADLAGTQPVNFSCNYSGSTGFRNADFRWIGINLGGNISTNMTLTQLGQSFAIYHSKSKRPFAIVASATILSGSVVTLKAASYGIDLEGSTGHSLEVSYIPPTHGNASLLVNGYPPPGFTCVPRDYSPPVIVEALLDGGSALVYFSEDVQVCSGAANPKILASNLGMSGITPVTNLTRWSNRVWHFSYNNVSSTTVTLSPVAGAFCDLNSNPNVVPSSPVSFLNHTLDRSYWTMYSGGEHSCKLFSNSSGGLVDSLVVVSMIPLSRSAVEKSFGVMYGFTNYALYSNTTNYGSKFLLFDKVLFESDDSYINSFVLRILNGFVPNEGYYMGYGVQFPTWAPQIATVFRLGYNFTGFALPPGFPDLLYEQLREVYPLDRSIPRLQSAVATVGRKYINVTFTHPRQVGAFHLYEFEFIGPIAPAAITGVYDYITVEIETASDITFADLTNTRLAFNGYIQYDSQSELYRNEVWRDYVNITNVDPKRPSVLYAELRHVGSGLFFDQLYFYFDEEVLETDSSLNVSVSSSVNNMTISVIDCAVDGLRVMCDVEVASGLQDRAYTQSENVAVALSGLVDSYGNEMNPFSTSLVYDKSAPSLKMAILAPNGTSVILLFTEPISGSFDTSGYKLRPTPTSCAQTSPVSIECFFGESLGSDFTVSFGDGSSIVDAFGNPVHPVTDQPVVPNALVFVQNKCDNIFGLPDVWLYTFLPAAILGWACVFVLLLFSACWAIKAIKRRQSKYSRLSNTK